MTTEELNVFLGYENLSVVEALQKIDKNAKGILFIIDKEGVLKGCITDGDVRRWLIKTGDLKAEISCFMNKEPKYLYQNNIGDYRKFLKKYSIKLAPVVKPDMKICDVVYIDGEYEGSARDTSTLKDVPVVIMAGGKGTRLYPYTKVLPKPLIPIGDIPIMERIIDKFCDFGVTNFYATLNYKRSMIKSYFAEVMQNYRLSYVEENEPLGTAGSLHLIEEEFDRPIFVTNCDILIHADYADIYKYHIESGNELTIVSALKNIVVPYGVINSKEKGVVTGLEEKPKLSYFVNTGMYVLDAKLLKEIPKDTFYHMTDLANDLLFQDRQVGMYPISEDSFLDMGELEEMRKMEEKLNMKS